MKKIIESKWFHILIIIAGSIFILLGAFHTEVWFDESYTIALISHDFSEIVQIDAKDVHPVLYYFLLKIVTSIFGNSILIARLFSVLAGILIGILGFTHIRKDFGPKVGLAWQCMVWKLECIVGLCYLLHYLVFMHIEVLSKKKRKIGYSLLYLVYVLHIVIIMV
jgi:hypothetical protein